MAKQKQVEACESCKCTVPSSTLPTSRCSNSISGSSGDKRSNGSNGQGAPYVEVPRTCRATQTPRQTRSCHPDAAHQHGMVGRGMVVRRFLPHTLLPGGGRHREARTAPPTPTAVPY